MKTKLLIVFFFLGLFVSIAQRSTNNDNIIEASQTENLNDFKISPNPSKHNLNIELMRFSDDLRLEVFDVLGKRVHNSIITKLRSKISVTNWKNGMYLVRLSNDKEAQTKRFIKQ